MSKRRYRFTDRVDARIIKMRAQRLTHTQVARELKLPLYIVAARITRLETLAKIPSAKLRICIRPDCNNEFVSREFSHRVCEICKHVEGNITEPFGNFPVVVA